MATFGYLLSCEHGGNIVPPAYQKLFAGHGEILQSHRGWDTGTLALGEYLSEALAAPLVYCTVTRLLIEMNRSLNHPQLFSEFSQSLSDEEKEQLILNYYLPYRESIQLKVEDYLRQSKCCHHFSLHSFTPVWNGEHRQTDIGLLFDPSRTHELTLCNTLGLRLKQALPGLSIHFNEPYLGIDDGLTTFLRTAYKDADYTGVEIEINQKWVDTPEMKNIREALLYVLHGMRSDLLKYT